MDPYYADESVQLYKGDCREVIPGLGQTFDCIVADPPYAETSLPWDRWPDGWPTIAATAASSMWCFGSMRMFLDRRDEFGAWRLSQDIVWEKHAGTRPTTDRFMRVHEAITHWYVGPWGELYHQPPRRARNGPPKGWRPSGVEQAARSEHTGTYGARSGYSDDGSRIQPSVITVKHLCQNAIHPTEKPLELVALLVGYICPPGGTVLDPFAGSGSTAAAARMSGRKAVLIEADERYCEAIVRRLQQDVLPLEA